MKIYTERIENGNFRNFKLFGKDCFACFLHGVNVSARENNVQVEPVYLPFISCEAHGGSAFIEISIGRPLAAVILFDRFPFINVCLLDNSIQLEDEE